MYVSIQREDCLVTLKLLLLDPALLHCLADGTESQCNPTPTTGQDIL